MLQSTKASQLDFLNLQCRVDYALEPKAFSGVYILI